MTDVLRLILHVGPPKTGTTSLQAGLNAMRRLLRENGVYYPRTPEGEKSGASSIDGSFWRMAVRQARNTTTI